MICVLFEEPSGSLNRCLLGDDQFSIKESVKSCDDPGTKCLVGKYLLSAIYIDQPHSDQDSALSTGKLARFQRCPRTRRTPPSRRERRPSTRRARTTQTTRRSESAKNKLQQQRLLSKHSRMTGRRRSPRRTKRKPDLQWNLWSPGRIS